MIPQIGMTCGCGKYFLIAARTGETYNCTCGREWKTNFNGSAVYLKPTPLIQPGESVLKSLASTPTGSRDELMSLVVFLLDQLGGSVVIPDSEFVDIQNDKRYISVFKSPEKFVTIIRIEGDPDKSN